MNFNFQNHIKIKMFQESNSILHVFVHSSSTYVSKYCYCFDLGCSVEVKVYITFYYTIYQEPDVISSVVLEWDLMCRRAGFHATIGAAPMGGYLVGGLLFGSLSDKYGRKPTFLLANFILLLGGMCCAFAPNYILFILGRFVVGMSIAGVESACFVMSLELVGPSKRTLAGILCWFFETGGLILAVGIGKLNF